MGIQYQKKKGDFSTPFLRNPKLPKSTNLKSSASSYSKYFMWHNKNIISHDELDDFDGREKDPIERDSVIFVENVWNK